MKVKRALLLIAVFLVSFTLSLYITFPVERIVKNLMVEKGLNPVGVGFNRFPPEITVRELPLSSITLKNVVIKPVGLKEFSLSGDLCGGKVELRFNYPVSRLNFELSSLLIGKCSLRLPVNLSGKVNGKGFLNFRGRDITGGKGKADLSEVAVKNVNFGIFSFKELRLGDGELHYTVSSRNYLKLKGNLTGRDGDVSVRGSLSYNPKDYRSSYLNLQFSVKMKSGRFSGRRFNFTVRGNINSLRFY